MGLSSKQVSSDGHDWNGNSLHAAAVALELPRASVKRGNQQQQQQQQQQSEPLKCPRCDSTNTKFCYYNNYNKSQPRHFCKTCKRHWTNGGTLRNVPVGGGRKNKRRKTSNTATSTNTTTTASTYNGKSCISNTSSAHMPIQAQNQRVNFPLPLGHDQKNFSETLIRQPPSSIQERLFSSNINFNGKSLGRNNSVFMGSALSLPLNQYLQYPYLSLSSFESKPSSISSPMQPSNLYAFVEEANSLEETVMACLDTTVSSSSMNDPAWINPSTNSVTMDMPINFGWDDIEKLVSYDLTIPWDDAELKP